MTLERPRCFYMRSDDDGVTFSKPAEITAAFDKFRPEVDRRVLTTKAAPCEARAALETVN